MDVLYAIQPVQPQAPEQHSEVPPAQRLHELEPLEIVGAALSSVQFQASRKAKHNMFLNATRCTDGIPNTFCQSTVQDDPWLSVRLGGEVETVSYVAILNRQDCCQEHLGDFEVWLGDASGAHTTQSATRCAAVPAIRIFADGVLYHPTLTPIVVECEGAARYVTLLLPGKDRVLHISEISAWSAPPSADAAEP